jgi:succinoglycan biosynthesis transport protein ExoP
VQQLSTKLAEVRSELSQAKVVYGTSHPNVKKLQSEVDELQAQLDSQKTAVLGSLRTSYSAARAREQLMDSQMKDATSSLSQMGRYNALKNEAAANSALYNTLYAKVKEAGISAASRSSNLRVVDEAHVLDSPTRPNRVLAIMVGLLAALVGGVGVAFLREQFDTRIFTAEDMRLWTGSTSVSIVPFFLASDPKLLPPPTNGGQAIVASDNGKLPPGVEFLLERPHSPEAEALRSLYTSVMLSGSGSPPQALLVVSSFPGEGKTTVAVNLAIAMAQHGTTCLVDADLRRGRVASALGIPNKLGLTDVLNGTTSLDKVLVRVPSLPNLTVVPAHAGSVRAGQLVCSDLMPKVLQDLRQQFQFIVIDCSPLLPFADGRVLSSMADGLIFVGRAGITTREVVQQSVQLLNGVKSAPIIEFVLNAADLNSPQYRYYQYGYEYYEPVAK